jgi:GMP synthase (glutamine-hydrolysing)
MKKQPTFLLLQVRNPNDLAKREEHFAFAKRLEIDVEQLISVDILRDDLSMDMALEHRAIFVGGAGEFSVLDKEDCIFRFIDFLGEAVEANFPLFASCFGFQAMVLSLGGEVVKDVPNAEVGTYELQTTDAARQDVIFSALPEQFLAQLGHQDRASSLPSGLTNVAYSNRTPFQAFHIPGKPVYATQFHPELTFEDNRKRFARYMAIYGKLFGEEEAQRRMDSHRPSPEANSLLKRFKEHILKL